MADPIKPSLVRKPVGAPAPSNIPVAQMSGGMPLNRNQVYVSDKTRQQLTALGLSDTDPIPADLGPELDRIRAEMAAEDAAADAANRPTQHTSVKPNKILKLEELSPKHQAEIQQLIAEAKASAAKPPPAPRSGILNSSVGSAVRNMQQMQSPPAADSPTITDDLLDDAPARTVGRIKLPTKATQPEPAAEASPNSDEPPEHDHTGAGAQPSHCPRCLWEINRPFTAEPTQEDRQHFMVGLLGLKRFSKAFPLLDGELTITYRTLTAVESRMVFEQLQYDLKYGKLVTQGDYLMAMADYRMSLAIESIHDKAGNIIASIPPVDELEYQPPEDGHKETPVAALLESVLRDIIPHESMQRIAGLNHRQFQRIVEAMEAQISEPSFWKGIEPSR